MAYPSNTESVAQDQIKAFVERIMRMRQEAKAINDDTREIYAEAKAQGFDKTVLGKLVNYVEKRATKGIELAEGEALFDLYLAAYDGKTGTPVATHTHEATREDRAKRRLSESMDDNKALSAQMLRDGLISPEAHAENVTISDGVARKLGAGVIDPETGEILDDENPVRPDDPVSTDDRGAHALSSVSNSAIPPADQMEEVVPPTSSVAPLQEGSEPVGAHNADPAGSTPAPATPAPSIASVNEPLVTVANDANAGGGDANAVSKAGEVAPHSSSAAAPAFVFSSKPRDGLYSADWLRRHGHCKHFDVCLVAPGRLCRDCSMAVALVEAAE